MCWVYTALGSLEIK